MFQKIVALCSASLLCGTMTMTPWTVSAEEAVDCPSITMAKCDALSTQPESKITGEIAVLVHDYPIHVTITMYSSEKPVTYYDTDLAPQEGTTSTEYIFLVDYSEYPSPDQLPTFDKQYTSDFLDGTYSSSYSVTITAPDTDNAVYTEESVLIADPHAESAVTGNTRYSYDVTFSETQEVPVIVHDPEVLVADGNAAVNRSIELLWAPYTLGDVDDNGEYTINDAYLILMYSSYLSAGATPDFDIVVEAADVDGNGIISINDAFLTLSYCSRISAGYSETFEEFLAEQLG